MPTSNFWMFIKIFEVKVLGKLHICLKHICFKFFSSSFCFIMENLEIRTGFEEISFAHLNLRDAQKEKGQKLLQDGHIINVKEIRNQRKGSTRFIRIPYSNLHEDQKSPKIASF